MSLFVYPPQQIDTSGLATEAKQDVIITELVDVNTELDSQTVILTSLDGKDYSTETTLATVKTDTASIVSNTADNATETTLATIKTDTASIVSNTADNATETTLATIKTDTASIVSNTSDNATETTLATVKTDTATIAGDTTSVDAKTPALGTALIAVSTPVNIASDQTVPVSISSIPLPTGASTEATLASIDGKDFSTQTTSAAILTELQLKADLTETQPVSVASLPLPTGAATEVTLSSIDGKDFATQTTSAALLTELQLKADLTETQPVSATTLPLPTGASTEVTSAALLTELQLKADLTETQPVSAVSLPLPTGAATEATLSAQSAKLPATLGQKTKAASLAVTLASDEDALSVSVAATTVTEFIRNDYSSTAVTTGAYVQLIASTTADVTKLRIFDSSGQTLKIATGAAAAEVDLLLVFPGGNEEIEVNIASGTRISIRAVSADAESGEISMNLIG